MGALFALFNTNELKNFELNWKEMEKSHPADASLYSECRKMLQICGEIQSSINNYCGGQEEIKCAMSGYEQGSDLQKEAIRKAMIRIIPNAALCQSWMQFAQKLSKFLVKRLLPRLSVPIISSFDDADDADDDDADNDNDADNDADDDNDNVLDIVDIENEDINYVDSFDEKKVENDDICNQSISELTILTHQALVHEFALMLDFLLTFDQTKMMEPQIQNDFSFYKRTLSKENESYLCDLEWSVSAERAGFISMFLAQAIPLMKEVATQLTNNPQCLKILAIFCNACLDLLKENKFNKDEESQKLVLRAMVAAFVIYDHGNTEFGAFQRRSDTKAQKIISMIANDYQSLYGNKNHCDGLTNIIKYATAHYNDNTTPASIKNALE